MGCGKEIKTADKLVKKGYVVKVEYSRGSFNACDATIIFFEDGATVVFHKIISVNANNGFVEVYENSFGEKYIK